MILLYFIVLVRWRQCAPPYTILFIEPMQFLTTSWSTGHFFVSNRHRQTKWHHTYSNSSYLALLAMWVKTKPWFGCLVWYIHWQKKWQCPFHQKLDSGWKGWSLVWKCLLTRVGAFRFLYWSGIADWVGKGIWNTKIHATYLQRHISGTTGGSKPRFIWRMAIRHRWWEWFWYSCASGLQKIPSQQPSHETQNLQTNMWVE